MFPQKPRLIVQRVQLQPVLLGQGRDLPIDGENLPLRLRRHAGGADGADQGALAGDVLPDALPPLPDQRLGLLQLPGPEFVPQQGLRALVVSGLHQLDGAGLPPVQALAHPLLFRDRSVQLQHVPFQRGKLFRRTLALRVLLQAHPLCRLAVAQGSQGRELLVQPALFRQQALDRLVFAVQGDVLQGEHRLPVQQRLSLLQLQLSAHQRVPAQLQDQIQLDAVDVGESAGIVPQLPVQPLHEGQHARFRRLTLRELKEIGVDLRRAVLPELGQRHVEFLQRVLPGGEAEEDVEILGVADEGVVLRLLPFPRHRVGHIFAGLKFKIDAASAIDVVQRMHKRPQLLAFVAELHNGGGEKNPDDVHSDTS